MSRLVGVLALTTALAGCSILAPSDDEYLGGSSTGGSSAGGSSSGGASGAANGGTGATAANGGTGATAGTGAVAGSAGSGGTAASGGTGGTATSGGTSGGGTAGASSGGGSGGTGGSNCTAGTTTATPQATAVYALLDRTVSGADWSDTASGVSQYVDSSPAAGTSFGLQYFPLSSGSCSGTGYSTPDVSIALLPGNANAIKGSLATPPSGNGPVQMDGVLQGGVNACKTYSTANGVQCNFVLLSGYDGTNDCGTPSSALTGILASARSTAPVVMTFVGRVTLQGTSQLSQFSSAGGTGSATYASNPGSVATLLRRAAKPCRFDLPTTATGGTVTWQLAGQTLVEVNGPGSCVDGAQQYYLTSGAMVLCPVTCSQTGNDASPNVTFTVTCS